MGTQHIGLKVNYRDIKELQKFYLECLKFSLNVLYILGSMLLYYKSAISDDSIGNIKETSKVR